MFNNYAKASNVCSSLNRFIFSESPKLKQKLATIQATVSGIVATSANCIEMFEEREQFWQEQITAVGLLHTYTHSIYTLTRK